MTELTVLQMDQPRFTRLQKIWHWITVLLLVGLAMSGLLYSAEVEPATSIRAHQAIGQTLILVLFVRLITKWRAGRTEPHPSHTRMEQLAARAMHPILYASLIVAAATGYISASALRSNILIWPVGKDIAWSPFGDAMLSTHFAMKWVLLTLIGLHVAAALKHHLIDRDDTLTSIWFRARHSKS